MADQEFYCSFTAAVYGAYYSNELRIADEENRILDFPLEKGIFFDTYWDLGLTDATAIWFVQYSNLKYFCIYYYENVGEHIPHYVNIISRFEKEHAMCHRTAYVPHDGLHGDIKSPGTPLTVVRDLGLRCEGVPKIKVKQAAIGMARSLFNKVTFHKTNCFQGLRALRDYHSKYNEKDKAAGKPHHNWASNGADAFLAIAQMENRRDTGDYVTYSNRVG